MPATLSPGEATERLTGWATRALPHRQAAWRILAGRLEELADRAEQLSRTSGLGTLAELADKLRGMAHDVQTA